MNAPPPIPASATKDATRCGAGIAKKRRGRPSPKGETIGREALVEIARKLLQTTPPQLVTRLAVARAADVDPALIRYYFGTVDRLIAEVVVDNHRKIHNAMEAILQSEDTAEWIKQRIANLVDLFVDNPMHHQMIMDVMYKNEESLEYSEWRGALRASIRYTQSQIELGTKQGAVRSVDVRMLHMLLISIGQLFGTSPVIVRDIFEGEEDIHSLRERYAEFVFDIIYNGLRVR